VVVATDMPFVSVGLFNHMKSLITLEVDVVIPFSEKGYEPFHAIYRKASCLPAIESAIRENKRRIISWFDAVNVATVEKNEIEVFDPKGLAFFNVNTPEDLHFAEQAFSTNK
jgi:molybdopterin-guanine dinucleotide biosynthesis protein A